jgi:hypothetical protein
VNCRSGPKWASMGLAQEAQARVKHSSALFFRAQRRISSPRLAARTGLSAAQGVGRAVAAAADAHKGVVADGIAAVHPDRLCRPRLPSPHQAQPLYMGKLTGPAPRMTVDPALHRQEPCAEQSARLRIRHDHAYDDHEAREIHFQSTSVAAVEGCQEACTVPAGAVRRADHHTGTRKDRSIRWRRSTRWP